MADEPFDAYYKWLGIPPDEQPPNFYRLLGVRPFEGDLDVIANAADQRMSHLRTYQTGKHAARSQAMLNEISGAKLCLLNPAKKRDYDQRLRQEFASRQSPATQPTGFPPQAVGFPPQAIGPPATGPGPGPTPVGAWPLGQVPRQAPPVVVGLPGGPGAPQRPGPFPVASSQAPRPAMVSAGVPPSSSVPADELGHIVERSARRRSSRPKKNSLVGPLALFVVVASAAGGVGWYLYQNQMSGGVSLNPIEPKRSVPESESSVAQTPKPEPSKDDEAKVGSEAKAPAMEVADQAPTAIDPAETQREALERLVDRLKHEVTAENVDRGEAVGGEEGAPFYEAHQGALLVGLELHFDTKNPGKPILCGLKGIFATAKGALPSHLYGVAGDLVKPVRAKPGYALGALEAVVDEDRVKSLRLDFMPITADGLAKQNRYSVKSVGERGTGQLALLGGDGRPLIGLRGTADETSIRSLGVIRPPKTAAPETETASDKSSKPNAPAEAGGRPTDGQTTTMAPTTNPPASSGATASASSSDSADTSSQAMVEKPRLAPPSEAEQSAALAKIRELFKTQYTEARAKSPQGIEARRTLSETLAREARQSGDDPAAAYVMFDEARKLAAQAGDSAAVTGALRAMGERFAIDDIKLAVESLTEVEQISAPAPAKENLAAICLGLADKAIERELFDASEQLDSLAVRAARSAGDNLLAQRVAWHKAKLAERRRERDRAQAAIETLSTRSDDPAANLAVGLYRCFAQNNWAAGLPLLAKGNDAALVALATTELAPPSEPADRAKLGDAWLAAAASNEPMAARFKGRARQWYEAALPELTGVTRLEVDKRLEDLLEGHGLTVDYFGGVDSFDKPLRQGVDAQVDLNLDATMPEGLDSNKFTARWQGWLAAPPPQTKAGHLTIIVEHDAGARLWFDNKKLIDGWNEPGTHSAIVQFPGNKAKAIKLEYFSRGGKSPHVSLRWAQQNGFTERAIGVEALFQKGATIEKTYSPLAVPRGQPLALPALNP